jgi:hypothetical protein
MAKMKRPSAGAAIGLLLATIGIIEEGPAGKLGPLFI